MYQYTGTAFIQQTHAYLPLMKTNVSMSLHCYFKPKSNLPIYVQPKPTLTECSSEVNQAITAILGREEETIQRAGKK